MIEAYYDAYWHYLVRYFQQHFILEPQVMLKLRRYRYTQSPRLLEAQYLAYRLLRYVVLPPTIAAMVDTARSDQDVREAMDPVRSLLLSTEKIPPGIRATSLQSLGEVDRSQSWWSILVAAKATASSTSRQK